MEHGVAHVQQIGPKRQMRSMFLENSERQQTCALRLLNGAAKVARG